jgi:hypothetical protein
MTSIEWGPFVTMGLASIAGLYVGLATKLGPRKPDDIGYILRRTGKYGGLMIGIGGSIITLFNLLKVLIAREGGQ